MDVSGGHHDAGDYSKYTINSASLVHYLMFAVDSLAGVAALDNLGIPESGDGISDVLQEAKWEADFLAKMQDTDGGFYFLVYPQEPRIRGQRHARPRRPAGGLAQDHLGHRGLRRRAGAVRLFAGVQEGLSRRGRALPAEGQARLAVPASTPSAGTARTAPTRKSPTTAITSPTTTNWPGPPARCIWPPATPSIHQTLLSWFDPADPATWRWGWWHMSECYGHAIRSYAFAVEERPRRPASQLDATFLAKCQARNRRRRRRHA